MAIHPRYGFSADMKGHNHTRAEFSCKCAGFMSVWQQGQCQHSVGLFSNFFLQHGSSYTTQEHAYFKYLRTGIQTSLVILETPSSQIPQGWKRPSRFNPTINLPQPQSALCHSPKHHSQRPLEFFQRSWPHCLPGQLIPMPDHSFSEKNPSPRSWLLSLSERACAWCFEIRGGWWANQHGSSLQMCFLSVHQVNVRAWRWLLGHCGSAAFHVSLDLCAQ